MKSMINNINLRGNYSAVRLQQGKVQTDSDWNESKDIGAKRIGNFGIAMSKDCFERPGRSNWLTHYFHFDVKYWEAKAPIKSDDE